MRKTHVNPRKLVDRLEKKYQKKTRFQIYKDVTHYFRETIFTAEKPQVRHDDKDSDIVDYEYI